MNTLEEIAAAISDLTEDQSREVNAMLLQDPDAKFILTGKPGTRTGDPDD